MRTFASNGMKVRNESRLLFLVIALFSTSALLSTSVNGQEPITNPMKSHDVKFDMDSGQIFHHGEEPAVVWSDEITVKGALWLRLNFRQLVLAGNPLGGPSSTLRITSLSDGAFQILNAETALQWRNTSAYFNGGSLRLELIAAPNGRMNQVVVDEVTVGEFDGVSVSETICDSVDDRELSDDPRNGRTAPGGCTGWLFDDRNNCMLTAGHCQASNEVMLFNVPLSDANGNRQFPPPEDQYAVDFASVQFVNGGVGNDWSYFGCFPNANTGLTAFEAQGDSYELGEPSAVQPDDMIRITGFGSTSFPVNPMWNGAQKTQVGPYALFTTNEIGYRTDTTGGNSGSPVILENTGQAIGIHTHGGCGSGGSGANLGTGFLQNGVSNALDNPQGICILSVNFSYPDGRPESLATDGSTSLRVMIDDADFDLVDATAMLNVDDGSGYQAIAMTALGGGVFEASFPVLKCGGVVVYFVSIESTDGVPFTDPINAPPNSYSALAAVSVDTSFADNFEADLGWSVSGNASTGQWQRGVPNGGGDRGDPVSDADGSGNCFVTQNGDGDTDVDGGSTVLTSPIIDATISDDQTAVLSYFRWFDNGGDGDEMVVEISNDGGASWALVESFDMGVDAQGGWRFVNLEVANFVAATSQMRVRFTVSDTGFASIVEAGVDDVRIRLINCEDDFLLGDVNMDGIVSLLDVQPFVDLIVNGGFQVEADINGDGKVDLLDVEPFVALISG